MRSHTEKIEFLKRSFGSLKIARDGVNVAVGCPSCGEKKGKFSINTDSWMCHCWICGEKSKNLYFILKKHRPRAHAKEFERLFGLPSGTKNKNIENEEDKYFVILPDNFVHLASFQGFDPDIRDVISYCKRRNITQRDMWYFNIGTCKSSYFKRRVIVPSFDLSGSLNYFVSRSIDAKGFPKYLNSKAKKTEIIFNEMNIDWNSELTLVEGIFDLMKASGNSTCLLGSKLSTASRLYSKIIENRTPILLALDQDMKLESHKIAKNLSMRGCSVRILENNTKKDVGEMSKKEFAVMSKESKSWSRDESLMFKIRSLKSGSLF